MIRWLKIIMAAQGLLLIFISTVKAQVSILPGNLEYIQNFNALSQTGTSNTWTNNTTIPGWYAANGSGLYSSYRAGDGSSSTTGLYSFGSTSDRALGSLNQDASG